MSHIAAVLGLADLNYSTFNPQSLANSGNQAKIAYASFALLSQMFIYFFATYSNL
jgi:hypothetical protein